MKEAARVFGIIIAVLYGMLLIGEYVHKNYPPQQLDSESNLGVLLLAGGLTGAWAKWGKE